MLPEGITIVELADAILRVSDIIGVVKFIQPATLQTLEVPCNVIYLVGVQQPMVIAYETEEKRVEEFELMKKAIVEYRY